MTEQKRTKTLVIGKKPVLETLKSDADIDKILVANTLARPELDELYQEAKKKNVVIQKLPIEKLNRITRANHQGFILFLKLVQDYDVQSIIDFALDKGETPLFLIIDGVTDVRNIGGMIRSAYAFGVHGVIVPQNGVAPLREDTMKTSAGTLQHVPICKVPYLQEAINTLRLNGILIIGTDSQSSTNIDTIPTDLPCAIILGSEDEGVQTKLLKLCDHVVQIPMKNKLNSLNVSVATGIALYSVYCKRR